MKKYSRYLKKKSCTIFLFHGVIKKNESLLRNYNKKHLDKSYFIRILSDLKKNGKAISMNDVLNNVKKKNDFYDRSFVITFDDGFYNNYSIALPILKKMNIPATFYITTDFIEKNLTSWVDRIEIAVNEKKKGKIKILNKNYSFINTLKSKVKFMNNLKKLIKENKKISPYMLANNIVKELNYRKNITTSNSILDKKMNWNHIRKINNEKLFIIGGHSKTHRILSFLSKQEVKNEINQSINILEKKLKNKINHYSYPEGLSHTFSNREIILLKKRGVQCSPSAEHGINNKNSNLFKLKRIFCV